MPNRLRINLLPTWSDKSADYPQAPATYIRHASANPGTLQVSWAAYTRAGPPPKFSDQDLLQTAGKLAKSRGGSILSQANGSSNWGRFGCVVATTPQFRIQVWVIHNGPDNVLVTHTGPHSMDRADLAEAEQIVMGIYVGEGEEQPDV